MLQGLCRCSDFSVQGFGLRFSRIEDFSSSTALRAQVFGGTVFGVYDCWGSAFPKFAAEGCVRA